MVLSQQYIVNRSTLVITSQRGGCGSFRGRGGGCVGASQENRDKLKCEHCGRFRHTKETYWNLHGHP